MNRTYELVFILDPRLADEDAVAIADDYRAMITAGGKCRVTKEESWGKRKLAYPIRKFNEGRYHIYYIESDPGGSFTEVEQRMRQNDKVLRYLTVRTDLDHKRAASKGKAQPERGESSARRAEA